MRYHGHTYTIALILIINRLLIGKQYAAIYIIDRSIAKYVPVDEDIVFNSMQSSLTVPVAINDNIITEGNVSFTVQLCRVSDPLEGVCIESTVTIVDNDGQLDIVYSYQLILLLYLVLVLVVGITELQYDRKTDHLTITVEILVGELCTECTVHATVSTTLILTGIIMKYMHRVNVHYYMV